MARVIVADNGEGIPPEDLKKIFSVFESRKGSRGTGLGLPVSQKILREHGGGSARREHAGGRQHVLPGIPGHHPHAALGHRHADPAAAPAGEILGHL